MFGVSYWFLPLFAGCCWLGTLLAMLGWWLAIGSPHYPEMEASQHIAYISDIGATKLQPLFIAGSAVTVVVFDIAFISERWLRHKGRLAHNTRKSEKILSICAVIASIIGAAGLILLTCFNTRDYHSVHDSMLVVFIGGYIVSAIFICAEYQRLGIRYRQHRILRISFWVKLTFIIVELALVIAFGSTEDVGDWNTAAVLEWTISLIYIFYVWSFVMDFLPAVHTKHDRFPDISAANNEMEQTPAHGENMAGGPLYTSDGYSGQSYGSQQPIRDVEQGPQTYYDSRGNVRPSQNF